MKIHRYGGRSIERLLLRLLIGIYRGWLTACVDIFCDKVSKLSRVWSFWKIEAPDLLSGSGNFEPLGPPSRYAKAESNCLSSWRESAVINRARYRAEQCPDSRWVFANQQGERIADVKTAFNHACSKAGITDFTMHDLRHTCASWLVMAGRPILEVREMLGHASVTMTERYAHLAPDKLKDAARALESKSHSGHTDFFVTKKSSGRCS